MHAHSYKYYLHRLEKKPTFSRVQKALVPVFVLILGLGGIVSAFLFLQYRQEAPLREQVRFLEISISSFQNAQTSLSEILSTFQVAGTKVKAVDTLKEATPTAEGYFVSLDDINRAIAQVQSTQQSLLEQKNQLSRLPTPLKFQQIRKELLAYYNQGTGVLEELAKEQEFQKEILVASGTSFYLPVLTDETLWKAQKAQPIIDYYEGKRRQANIALADLSRLAVPEDFKAYYDTQIAYLELLANVAADINKALSQADETSEDSIPQIEKAYQILQEAKSKNGPLSQSLLAEKTKVFDKKRNLEKFAEVNISQNALQAKLSDLYQNQPQPKTYAIPQAIMKLLNLFPATQFLQV
ncbi:MAG: hypothetical protein WD988_02740 [Candidatus Curtissbacteria bacterium]